MAQLEDALRLPSPQRSLPAQTYIGYTENLRHRLEVHNSGGSVHTNKFKPWRIVTYLAFADKQAALDFEIYLKTGSGQAFARKRLWGKLHFTFL